MKILVKLLQLTMVLLMLYPLYYVWETDKINSACQQMQPGMSYNDIVIKLDRFGLGFSRINGDYAQGEKWLGLVESKVSFYGYVCEIRGIGNQVAGARILKGKQVTP